MARPPGHVSTHRVDPPRHAGRVTVRARADAAVLATIIQPGVEVAVWRRRLPRGLDDALAAWVRRDPPGFDRVLDAAQPEVAAALTGLAPAPWRRWLHADLELLLGHFVAVTGAREVRFALAIVRTDPCRDFHVDRIRYRLLTTYLGPGTEWAPDEAIDRTALAAGAPSTDIVPRPALIRRAGPGDVLLMKGAHAREREDDRAAVLRSPSIEGTGAVRVVLAISTVDRA